MSTIILASTEVLRSPAFRARLGLKLGKILDRPDMSTRTFPDFANPVFSNFDGKILRYDGKEFANEYMVFETGFSEYTEYRYLSALKVFASRPPEKQLNLNLVYRMELFDAFFKILGDPVIPG